MVLKSSDLGIVEYTKENIPLTWIKLVRGILVQILAQPVMLKVHEAFVGRQLSGFLENDAQSRFVHVNRKDRGNGTMTAAKLSDGR